jgi:hypothetical protein
MTTPDMELKWAWSGSMCFIIGKLSSRMRSNVDIVVVYLG